MCRTGGRRCPGSSAKATQNTRKAVSRARQALRAAQTSGDPETVTAARQRLDTARAAHRQAKENAANQHHNHHRDEGQDHTAGPTGTTAHAGDVTPPTATGDTTTTQSTQDSRTHRYGGFMIRNTNTASGNAHVGSQHDVYYGTTRTTSRTRPTAGEDGDVTDHDRDDDTTADDRRGTHNTASGNDHVTQQVGFSPADLRRLRRR